MARFVSEEKAARRAALRYFPTQNRSNTSLMTFSDAFSPVRSQRASSASSTQTDTASSPNPPLTASSAPATASRARVAAASWRWPERLAAWGLNVVGAQQAGNSSGDHSAAPLFLAADREHHGKIACNDLCVKLSGLVLFVDQCNGRTTGAPLRQRKILPGQGLRAIEHRQDQPRLFQLFPAAADALGLDRILGLPQTGRVEQVQPDVPQTDGLLHHIPGGARHGGDDGPVEPGQQVEQGGLARIGPPHDGTVHTLPQDCTGIVIPDEGVQLSPHGSQSGYQLGILQRGNVLLGEIHPGSQMGLQGGQGILFSPDLLRQRAVQGGIGQRRTLSAIGRDQIL